jgi:transposase InsO family protein
VNTSSKVAGCDLARRRAVSLLHPHHVPPARSPGRILRTPPPTDPSSLSQARAPGHGSNQLWSWDITRRLGPAQWTYFYLYVILDVFSRYVTGGMVAMRESAELAKPLIQDSCTKQRILPGPLTLHADRGTSMSSKPVAFLLADLGVTKTHSRPHVSDDNPYSESQFRTMKYSSRVSRPLRLHSGQSRFRASGMLSKWGPSEPKRQRLAVAL